MVVILWEIRWLFLIKKFPSYIKRIVQKASTASTQLRSCYNIIFGQCKKFFIFFYFFINPLHLSKATHKCCCIFLHNLDHPDFEWDQYLRGSFSSMKKKRVVRWKFMRITRTSFFFVLMMLLDMFNIFTLFQHLRPLKIPFTIFIFLLHFKKSLSYFLFLKFHNLYISEKKLIAFLEDDQTNFTVLLISMLPHDFHSD